MSWIQCSHCFKIYNFDDYMKLEHEWVKPKEQKYGKQAICGNCGKSFHNAWRMNTLVNGYEISTVHLEIGHHNNAIFSDNPDEMYWYETMIFSTDDKVENPPFQVRYQTKTEAIAGHELAVNNLAKIVESPDKYPHSIFFAFEQLMNKEKEKND